MAIPDETIDERFTCVAHASGRLFFGVNNTVYFTQVMEGESIAPLAKCYQANDPTSENISDLLATDGGSIQINDANNIIKIQKYGNGVLVLADNGVWYIAGPDTGFTATNFSLRGICRTGCLSAESVVQVESSVYYWSDEGIYMIEDNQFGIPEETNITENTIQTYYNTIPKISKQKCNGVYNRIKKQIEWFYSDDTQTGSTEYKYAKDRSLLYDIRSQGFFPQTYLSDLSETTGQFLVSGVSTSDTTEDNNVWYITIVTGAPSTTQTYSIDFSTKTDTDFEDWSTDYTTAYIETGYEVLAKPSHIKTAPYATFHFVATEENWITDGGDGLILDKQSSCKMRPKWDWNDTITNGRWGPEQEIYRYRRQYTPAAAGAFDSSQTVLTTKNKILGRGKALSFRLEQTQGKDMQLLGWTTSWNIKNTL